LAHDSAFEQLDEKPFSRFHVLAMFATGMGVFTDGYDLSSIGIVLKESLHSFGIDHVSGLQTGCLAAAALVGSTLGASVFGALAQRGRKRYYGIDVSLMAVAALAQAFAPGLWTLIAVRFVLGIGVGADYVLSPTIMAEHANRRDRGKKLAFGFAAMWGFGAMAAALLSIALKRAGVSEDLQWRIVLGAGMVPALSVLTLRRRMPETARYLARVAGEGDRAQQVIQSITGQGAIAPTVDRRAWRDVLAQHMRVVLGAALLWLIYDVVVYSNVLFGPTVMAKGLGLSEAGFTLLGYGAFIVPGTLLGCVLIDRAGRKVLLGVGFVISGLALLAFAPMQSTSDHSPVLAFTMFGIYAFTMSLGPGSVTGSGLLGVELAPTRIRSIAQAVTVVGGRIGAVIAGFAFPILLEYISTSTLVAVLAGVAVLGGILAFVLVPETKGRSLEDINADTDALIAAD
jgi:MFS family permease